MAHHRMAGYVVGAGFVLGSILTCTSRADVDWSVGNCNGTGGVDISDVIYSLDFLFEGGPPPCAALCDLDESGDVDVGDPVFLLDHLFGARVLPPTPERPVEVCDGVDEDCDGEIDNSCIDTEHRGSVQVAWDPVREDVQGNPEEVRSYELRWGRSPNELPNRRRVFGRTEATVGDLEPGVEYWFTVAAVDLAGNRSAFSILRAVTVPVRLLNR